MNGPSYSAAELLARLVHFDTTSHKSNLALVAFIEDYLAQHGLASQLVPNAEASKASLYASIGPPGVPGVALSGHTDVVPVEGQTWSSDPFVLAERDGRLYGRGTADMKGFLACVLAAVPDFLQRKLAVPIHLVFSYDEEVGCLGVRPLIAEIRRRFVTPRMVVVGEPTSMSVVDAHKGPVRWHVEVKGRAAHSSMAPLGVNAISVAGKLLQELSRIERELKVAPRAERFDPPYATLQVTRIDGGTATNIVPVYCRFDFDVRALPGVDVTAIDRRIRAFAERECVPEMRRVAPEIRHRHPRGQSSSPLRRRKRVRGRRVSAPPRRLQRDARRLLRDRSRTVPGGGLVRRRHWPGRHRAGALSRRVHRQRPARHLHGLPRPPRRMGRARRARPLASSARRGISAFGTNVANPTFSPKEKRPTKTW